MLRILAIFSVLAFLGGGLVVSAQTPNDGITVTITPERPGPQQEVAISLVSYGIDLEAATIIWKEDGVTKLSGVGKHRYVFTTKGVGEQTRIDVQIGSASGTLYSRNIIITPMGVDLLWEAKDSVVPPLYKGKALPSQGGRVTFIAIPNMVQENGSRIAPGNLIYSWTQNYKTVSSGSGRSSFTTTLSTVRDGDTIRVNTETTNRLLGASRDITLSADEPILRFYELSPLFGPRFETALADEYTLNEPNISLIAFPYFLSPKDPTSTDLEYTWAINDRPTTRPTNPNVLLLNRESEDTGTAFIDLTISNPKKFFQSISGRLTLTLE